jgi:hypothetical protein
MLLRSWATLRRPREVRRPFSPDGRKPLSESALDHRAARRRFAKSVADALSSYLCGPESTELRNRWAAASPIAGARNPVKMPFVRL